MNARGRGAAVAALSIAALTLVACAPGAQNGDTVSSPALVPLPASVSVDDGAPFRLTPETRLTGDPDAATAAASALHARTGVALESGESGDIDLQLVPGGEPESYRIVANEASVSVTAPDAAGLFYGAQTLAQLVGQDGDAWIIPAVTIEDAPRFAYRGVMLDVARHFFPVEVVKAYIDRAASLKLNALHLHLSDDQGWRIELSSRPRLTELASGTSVGGDPGGFYSKADYREIVEYAATRHMLVVPEIDLPGHTHAVGLAYPELAEAPVLSEGMTADPDTPTAGAPYTGIAVGFSSLKIHDEATYDFIADVFGELAAMTPGPYLHLGGDEAHGTDPADFAVFMERATRIVADLGKTPVTWHEAGAAAGLAPDTIGQYWGFTVPTDGMDDDARAFVHNGSQLILSPADAAYLDMKYDDSTPLGLTWANGPTSVERAYSWDPASVVDGVADDDILGVEAPLWSETIRTLDDIDTMAFPRIAAAAEIAWSPSPSESGARTWDAFRARVGRLGGLWSGMGIGYFASPEIDWTGE